MQESFFAAVAEHQGDDEEDVEYDEEGYPIAREPKEDMLKDVMPGPDHSSVRADKCVRIILIKKAGSTSSSSSSMTIASLSEPESDGGAA